MKPGLVTEIRTDWLVLLGSLDEKKKKNRIDFGRFTFFSEEVILCFL